jgi:hypothetical protein
VAGGLLHVDAVQGRGRIDGEIGALNPPQLKTSIYRSRGGAASFCRRARAPVGVAQLSDIRPQSDFAARRHLRGSGWMSAEGDIIRGRGREGHGDFSLRSCAVRCA